MREERKCKTNMLVQVDRSAVVFHSIEVVSTVSVPDARITGRGGRDGGDEVIREERRATVECSPNGQQ